MKLTVYEIFLICLTLLVLAIGVDHLLLRQKNDFQKWQNEATMIINNHDILLKRITDQMNVQRTLPIPEQGLQKKGP
jgi:hypothetical protein